MLTAVEQRHCAPLQRHSVHWDILRGDVLSGTERMAAGQGPSPRNYGELP